MGSWQSEAARPDGAPRLQRPRRQRGPPRTACSPASPARPARARRADAQLSRLASGRPGVSGAPGRWRSCSSLSDPRDLGVLLEVDDDALGILGEALSRGQSVLAGWAVLLCPAGLLCRERAEHRGLQEPCVLCVLQDLSGPRWSAAVSGGAPPRRGEGLQVKLTQAGADGDGLPDEAGRDAVAVALEGDHRGARDDALNLKQSGERGPSQLQQTLLGGE